jgi:Ca2+/Na+ antiporter
VEEKVKIKSETDFWTGVMYIAIGGAFAAFATEYDYGTPQRMGPAFFPTMLGGLLIFIGLVVGLQGLAKEDPHGHSKVEKFNFPALAWITGAIIAYGLLLRPLGIILTNVVLVVISMMASHQFKWKEAIGLSIVMGIIVYGVFVYGLKLTVPVWPGFLTN